MSPAGFIVINPYLLTGLYGLATVIIFWLMAGPQRMLMLLAGAITLPFFPLAALFNGDTGHRYVSAAVRSGSRTRSTRSCSAPAHGFSPQWRFVPGMRQPHHSQASRGGRPR